MCLVCFEGFSMVETRATRGVAGATSGTRDKYRPRKETVTSRDNVETTVLRSAND